MRSVSDENNPSERLPLNTQRLILVIIKEFLGHGAQLDQVLYTDVIEYQEGVPVGPTSLAASDILTRMFTHAELEELNLSKASS